MNRHSQSAIDIKARRIGEGVNRLAPEYLSRWRSRYDSARSDYIHGESNAIAFIDRLHLLGFRDDALRAEVADATQNKNNPAEKPPRFFKYQL